MTNLETLQKRHSVRSYGVASLSEKLRNTLRSEVTFINTHEAGLNFQICFDDEAPFKGFGRSYGMFRGVRNYLVAVVDPTFPEARERAGYYAEQFVVEAVKAGLGTCFVGGTFSKTHVNAQVEVYEKIPFVVAFGVPEETKTPLLTRVSVKFMHRSEVSPRDLFDGNNREYDAAVKDIPWLDAALEAVALAPSALNKRPVRLRPIYTDAGVMTVTAHTIGNEPAPVDLGIAKLNVAYAVGGVWEWGENGIFHAD